MTECEQREKLVEYGVQLLEAGLVQGTWGNLSVRLSDRQMLVSPSGIDYRRLTAADMVKVDLFSLQYEGDLKPTSEKGVHAEIYRTRRDVGAIIHTHSKYCTMFAAARKDVPITEAAMIERFGPIVKTAAYALPGTKALWTYTLDALGENQGCIMANHGMLCVGETIEAAFANCCRLETYCGAYIEGRYVAEK